MAITVKLDDATLAKVREYATETFEGFDAGKTAIISIKRRIVEIPPFGLTITTEPHTLKDGTVVKMGYGRAQGICDEWFSVLAVKVAE